MNRNPNNRAVRIRKPTRSDVVLANMTVFISDLGKNLFRSFLAIALTSAGEWVKRKGKKGGEEFTQDKSKMYGSNYNQNSYGQNQYNNQYNNHPSSYYEKSQYDLYKGAESFPRS